MDTTLCKLTLVLPTTGAERIVELMLGSEPPVTGFTMWRADGHGESFSEVSVSERVRGRVERSMFVAVMERSRAGTLVNEIIAKAPIPHMAYWIEPVLEFGRTSLAAMDRSAV